MGDDLLTVEEAAKKLRLHLDTARRFVREGRLAATKVGRRYLIPESAIRDFIQQGMTTTSNDKPDAEPTNVK